MEITVATRFKHAWNAFLNRDPTRYNNYNLGYGYSSRPDRPRLSRGNERSIITSIINRIALDVAAINILHCRLDDEGRFIETIDSDLNNCLTLEANIDQTARAFRHDAAMSMFDEGVIALVPVDTDTDPDENGSVKIYTVRTAKIIEWYPAHVKVEVYNDRIGQKQELTFAKTSVCILENPFYAVMNEHNSTMQRLIRKLSLLDFIDEASGSGKLDMIIQLPYTVKTDLKREQAEKRKKDLEVQLTNSKYGIAYIDSTERITQLNRPVENNLMKQIEYLMAQLFSQLGMTQGILDGTADEKTMQNYNTRIVEPAVSVLVDEMKRKWLSKTARSQKQSIEYFRDPFKLVPITELAEITDKMTRNEVMTSNEIRQKMGLKPSKDPKADQLVNSNLNQNNAAPPMSEEVPPEIEEGGNIQNGEEV